MKRFTFCLLSLLVLWGCNGRLPLGPDSIPQDQTHESTAPVEPELVSIQGRVYARVNWGDPLLPDVLITVRAHDGSETTTMTDADGFYEELVRPGTITITASKEGYEPKSSEVALLADTVLNFGLVPK